ncbi:hypothetical protein ACUXNS_000513 [Brevibacterium pityocampae]
MTCPESSWAEVQGRWWSTDVLRILAVLSVPLAWWYAGFASGACLFLVLGGVTLLRFLVLPRLVDALCQLIFLAAAWAAVTGLYQNFSWLDIPAHALATAAAVLIAWRLVMLRDPAHRVRPDRSGAPAESAPPAAHGPRDGAVRPPLPWWSLLWHLLALSALLSVLWEFGEWAGFVFISEEIGVGYHDTIGDLAAGTLGGGLLALPLALGLEREADRSGHRGTRTRAFGHPGTASHAGACA